MNSLVLRRARGFTLIELMVAMVIGLTAVTSVYTLGSAMSKQFYEEQRVATSQGTSRVAIMELRRDISRAGLFGTPNAAKEASCDGTNPQLPAYGGGNLPLAAFQFYPDADLSVLDPDGVKQLDGDLIDAALIERNGQIRGIIHLREGR